MVLLPCFLFSAPIILDDFDFQGSLQNVKASGPAPSSASFGPDALSSMTFGSYTRSGTVSLTLGTASSDNATLGINGGSGNLQYQVSNDSDGKYQLIYDPTTSTLGNATSVLFDFQNVGNKPEELVD